MCERELMVNELCHSSTVLMQYPQTSIGQPPIRNISNAQRHRRHQVILVQPAQLGEFDEVGNQLRAGCLVAVRQNPADVRPREAAQRRRMQVFVGVRILVMVPVMGGPPQHALLRRTGGHQRDDELKRAAGLVRAMREIAVIAGGHEEHAHVVQRQADSHILPRKRQEKGSQTGHVHGHHGDGPEYGNPVAAS